MEGETNSRSARLSKPLLELSGGGKRALSLPDGETRRFLEDGDEVIMRGWCERAGAARVGFGELVGRVLGARR